MRASSIILALAAAATPMTAFASDAPRRLAPAADYASPAPVEGPVIVERVVRPTGVVVKKLAGQRYRVIDSDGTVLSRSFPLVPPPRRIEERVYYSPDRPARRPHLLYGGFYGLDRWGVGREEE